MQWSCSSHILIYSFLSSLLFVWVVNQFLLSCEKLNKCDLILLHIHVLTRTFGASGSYVSK